MKWRGVRENPKPLVAFSLLAKEAKRKWITKILESSGSCSVYFFSVNGSDPGKLYVSKESHPFKHYPDAERRKLADISKVNAIFLPSYSVVVGLGCPQHAGAEFIGHPNLRYHVYLVLHYVWLQDSIFYGSSWSVRNAGHWEGARPNEPRTGERDLQCQSRHSLAM